MTEKRYFLHKHLGRDVINDTLCHNWLKGEELEEHMNVQYTKYSALKKENEQLKEQLILANGFIRMIENCYEDMTIEDILYEKYGEFQDELHLQMAIAKEEIE